MKYFHEPKAIALDILPMDEWNDVMLAMLQSGEDRMPSLPVLLAIVAEATRELCAEFPNNQCHNGATNNHRVAEKVAAHIRGNWT